MNSGLPSWAAGVYHTYDIQSLLEMFVGVSCAIAVMPPDIADAWRVIYGPTPATLSMLWWEARSGRQPARERYNTESFSKVQQSKCSEVRSFRGLSDLWVPVLNQGRCEAVIAAGPFVTKQLGAQDILRQWSDLGKTTGDLRDPDLARYALAALSLEKLEPHELDGFRELLEMFARALVTRSVSPVDSQRISELRRTVFGPMPRARESKTASMLDPVSNAGWAEVARPYDREELGIDHMPNTVIALVPDEIDRSAGVVSELVEAQTFQRGTSKICRELDNTLAAPLADYGAYVLFYSPERRNSARRRLEMQEQARVIAERVETELGRRVTMGLGGIAEQVRELPELARRAASAVELAVHSGARSLLFDDVIEKAGDLPALQAPPARLARLLEAFSARRLSEVDSLQADYVRAALIDSGGRTSRVRLHLEYALGALLADLSARGGRQANLTDVEERLRRSLDHASSGGALAGAFREAVTLLIQESGTPKQGELELSLTRAARYIDAHCDEALTQIQVARRVGLSRSYFSRQFKATFGFGFEEYLRRKRVERSEHLLRYSSLSIKQIADACGFASAAHFDRVFRRAGSETPSAYRAKFRPQKAR